MTDESGDEPAERSERKPFLPDSTVMGFPLGYVRALARYVEIDQDPDQFGLIPEEVAKTAGQTIEWLRRHHLYAIEVLGWDPLPWKPATAPGGED